jgi:hypothetical protein
MHVPQPNLSAVMHSGGQHPIEEVIAVGNVLTGEGAGDGVAEAEDALVRVVALGERTGEPQSVVAALVPVRGPWSTMSTLIATPRLVVECMLPPGGSSSPFSVIGADPAVQGPPACRSPAEDPYLARRPQPHQGNLIGCCNVRITGNASTPRGRRPK